MGFISNIAGTISDSINSEINDQYLEAFRTDSLGQNMLVKRAHRLNSNGRNQGSSDIISAGSKVLVPEGTYALMIDNGQIVDTVTTPGLYTWENSSSGSVTAAVFVEAVEAVDAVSAFSCSSGAVTASSASVSSAPASFFSLI